jgi:hypothetical protein
VLLTLARLYQEHFLNRRPLLRQICEQDQPASVAMHACLLDVFPQAAAAKVPATLLLTDGTYALRAHGDASLALRLCQRSLVPGGKLLVVNAELEGPGPHPPLEARDSTWLTLHGNSCQTAPPHAALGPVAAADLPVQAIADLDPGAGMVPCLEVEVVRCLPLIYLVEQLGQRVRCNQQSLEHLQSTAGSLYQKVLEETLAKLSARDEQQEREAASALRASGQLRIEGDEEHMYLAMMYLLDGDGRRMLPEQYACTAAIAQQKQMDRQEEAAQITQAKMLHQTGLRFPLRPLPVATFVARCVKSGVLASFHRWHAEEAFASTLEGTCLRIHNAVPKPRPGQRESALELNLPKQSHLAPLVHGSGPPPPRAPWRCLSVAEAARYRVGDYIDMLGQVEWLRAPVGEGGTGLQSVHLLDQHGDEFVLQCFGTVAFHHFPLDSDLGPAVFRHLRVHRVDAEANQLCCELTAGALVMRNGLPEAVQAALNAFAADLAAGQIAATKAARAAGRSRTPSRPLGSPLRASSTGSGFVAPAPAYRWISLVLRPPSQTLPGQYALHESGWFILADLPSQGRLPECPTAARTLEKAEEEPDAQREQQQRQQQRQVREAGTTETIADHGQGGTVGCPLCQQAFSPEQIESHSSECGEPPRKLRSGRQVASSLASLEPAASGLRARKRPRKRGGRHPSDSGSDGKGSEPTGPEGVQLLAWAPACSMLLTVQLRWADLAQLCAQASLPMADRVLGMPTLLATSTVGCRTFSGGAGRHRFVAMRDGRLLCVQAHAAAAASQLCALLRRLPMLVVRPTRRAEPGFVHGWDPHTPLWFRHATALGEGAFSRLG